MGRERKMMNTMALESGTVPVFQQNEGRPRTHTHNDKKNSVNPRNQ